LAHSEEWTREQSLQGIVPFYFMGIAYLDDHLNRQNIIICHHFRVFSAFTMQKLAAARSNIILLLSLLLLGCNKHEKFKRTVKVCNDRFFVEVYNTNPAGIDVHYLTDSVSFRFLVGKFDNDHENFSYSCEGDTITIKKLESAGPGQRTRNVSNIRKFGLHELRTHKIEN
jgi:hypothetical protein